MFLKPKVLRDYVERREKEKEREKRERDAVRSRLVGIVKERLGINRLKEKFLKFDVDESGTNIVEGKLQCSHDSHPEVVVTSVFNSEAKICAEMSSESGKFDAPEIALRFAPRGLEYVISEELPRKQIGSLFLFYEFNEFIQRLALSEVFEFGLAFNGSIWGAMTLTGLTMSVIKGIPVKNLVIPGASDWKTWSTIYVGITVGCILIAVLAKMFGQIEVRAVKLNRDTENIFRYF